MQKINSISFQQTKQKLRYGEKWNCYSYAKKSYELCLAMTDTMLAFTGILASVKGAKYSSRALKRIFQHPVTDQKELVKAIHNSPQYKNRRLQRRSTDQDNQS